MLGNCVYDKDYLSKVIKVKAAPVRDIIYFMIWCFSLMPDQARWDVDELHRHRDYAPIKREPAASKRISEDDDLPPARPAELGKSSNTETNAIFDGDGEFGSMLKIGE